MGLAGFIAMFLTTLPSLVLVKPVDFAQELEREYKVKPGPHLGAMELAKDFIRKTTKPASLADYIARKTEHRLLNVQGEEWDLFYQALAAPPAANPWASRWLKKHGFFVYRWDETPLQEVKSQIEEKSRTWTINYLALGPGERPRYLEVGFGYGYEPKKLGAPAALVYPHRAYCWLPLLAGAVGFAGLRRRRLPAALAKDPWSSVYPLDLVGFGFFVLFFAIPFRVADPTRDLWGADLGVTIWCWLAAAAALILPVWAARNASFALTCAQGQLTVQGLWGRETFPLSAITAVATLRIGGIDAGIVLEFPGRPPLQLPWDNVINYPALLQALQEAGLHLPAGGAGPTPARLCAACGTATPADSRFCPACGEKLSPV